MDRIQFTKFCTEWKAKGAFDFTRKSHYEEMSPLLEPHAEVVEVHKDEFHALTGGVFYPRKETSDRLGKAAGISFSGEVRIIKQPDGAWVGTAYPQELGPDGKMITWGPASYEFNPADRAEEELLRKSIKDAPEGTAPNAPTEVALKLKTLEYKKVALRRADTGARVAAIISTIGMPTGFKYLFSDKDGPSAVRVFLFSRVIVNTKNEMVLNRALDSMFGAAKLLGGPSAATAQIADETGGEPPMRQAETFTDDEASGIDDSFGTPADKAAEALGTPRSQLEEIRKKYDAELPIKGKGNIDKALEDPKTPDDRFIFLYGQAQDFLATKNIVI